MTSVSTGKRDGNPSSPELRVKFWGTQGSCAIFPEPPEVREYARLIAVNTLFRTFEHLQSQEKDGVVRLAEALDGDPSLFNTIESFQQKIGLPELPIFGGETSCVEVKTSEGNSLILDGGTGIRHCGAQLVADWDDRRPRKVIIFGSHEHLDHRVGLHFARFCHEREKPFHVHLYGSYGFLMALDDRFGLFGKEIRPSTYLDDPLDYRMMAAKFTATELRNYEDDAFDPKDDSPPWDVRDMRKPIQIGSTIIRPFDVYHGTTRCLGYRIEHDGAVFVYCTDHELRLGEDPNEERQLRSMAAEERVLENSVGADLAYFDGQYFREEYLGERGIGHSPPVPRIDWGHSCIEDVIERARKSQIRHVVIGHHDPERTWSEQMRVERRLKAAYSEEDFRVELAKADSVIEVRKQ